MTEFAGRVAVVTGGGSGMGRELVRQLVAEASNTFSASDVAGSIAIGQVTSDSLKYPCQEGSRRHLQISEVTDRRF